MTLTERQSAMLASFYAGIIFGIFWIPLRALEDAGFGGAWAAALYTGLPVIFLLPVFWTRRREYRAANWMGLLGGVIGGLAFSLYSIAFLYTDVVRAVLLFYLMPVWGFVLGRIFLNDPITPMRCFSIIAAFAGMLVIFGIDEGIPIPKNVGDWVAIASGLTWAFASLMILLDKKVSVLTHTANFFLSSAIFSILAALVFTADTLPTPTLNDLGLVLPWMIPVALIITLPGGFATIYGPTKLNPGIVGLLFMAEIGVATVSAAFLTDETFGTREAVGVILVTGAGLLEPFREAFGRRKPGTRTI